MKLNQGMQKYRESSTATRKGGSKSKLKNAGIIDELKQNDKEVSNKTDNKPPIKSFDKPLGKSLGRPSLQPTSTDQKNTDNAATNLIQATSDLAERELAAKEEALIHQEIAAELEEEAVVTSQLVKEDCSPVNSSRERLVREYAALIKYIAQKIASRLPANIELDDLMSAGVIGLMDAIEKYDSGRDNKFKTYAEFRIRGAILDELRAQDWVPRSVREKAKMLERCYLKIEQQKGRHATDEEICEELHISQGEFHDLLGQVRSISLLSYEDILNFSKSDKRFLHGLGEHGSRSATPFSEISIASIKKMISDAIHDLPEKQRLVLSLYYYEDLNLKEIGRILDVTESRVSQLHTQAIVKLKSKLKHHWDEVQSLFG